MLYEMESLFIIFICLELFEFFWQKGDSIREFVQNLFSIYDTSLIFFISLHVSFFFVLFCIFALNMTSGILFFIAFFKFADISTKIYILHKIQNAQPLGEIEFILKTNYPLSNTIKLIPLFIYGISFYTSLI